MSMLSGLLQYSPTLLSLVHVPGILHQDIILYCLYSDFVTYHLCASPFSQRLAAEQRKSVSSFSQFPVNNIIAEYAALFYPVKWNSPIISQWILYKTDNGSAISIIAPVKMEAVMAV